jgi:RNA polymerase sigma-70 factor (ECF subfamily)
MVAVPNRADARDVLQECSVALWRNFAEYDSERPFLNWALGFARIEVRRFLRTAQRRAQLTERAAELLLETEAQHQAQLDAREPYLRPCLDSLPPEHRDLIDGYYRDSEPVAALATRTGRTVEAVYKLLQRIRLALHQCVESKLRGMET